MEAQYIGKVMSVRVYASILFYYLGLAVLLFIYLLLITDVKILKCNKELKHWLGVFLKITHSNLRNHGGFTACFDFVSNISIHVD